MDWNETGALVIQIAAGVSLAACAGLRAFLPLLAVGVAGRLELLPLRGSFEWMSEWPALTIFGVAVILELLGDKFPILDHFLDSVQVLVKPVAGALLAASVLTQLSPLQAAVLAIIAGGTVAEGVHLAKAKVRLLSSVGTAGVGNPVLSVIEDIGAVVGSVLSILVPLLVLALLVLALVALVLLLRRGRGAVAGAGSPG